MAVKKMRLFVYGTLKRKGRMRALTSARLAEPRPGVLRGYRKYDTGAGYPVIFPDPDREVEGLIWEIEADALAYIDHYEGADRVPPVYFRREEQVECEGETLTAQVYVGNPAAFPDLLSNQADSPPSIP